MKFQIINSHATFRFFKTEEMFSPLFLIFKSSTDKQISMGPVAYLLQLIPQQRISLVVQLLSCFHSPLKIVMLNNFNAGRRSRTFCTHIVCNFFKDILCQKTYRSASCMNFKHKTKNSC